MTSFVLNLTYAYMNGSSESLGAVGVLEEVGALGDKGGPGDKSFSCVI